MVGGVDGLFPTACRCSRQDLNWEFLDQQTVDTLEGASAVSEPSFWDWLEWNRGKDARSFRTDCIQGARLETQCFENGRRHLGSTHSGAHRPGFDARIGQQQNDIRVVMGESAV